MTDSIFLTVTQAAEILRVHPNTIRRLCNRGELPHFKLHSQIRIPKDAFDKMLEESKNADV